jgi:hypothetical protein
MEGLFQRGKRDSKLPAKSLDLKDGAACRS